MEKISIKGDIRAGLKLVVNPSLSWEEIKEVIWKELEKKAGFLKGISLNVDLKDKKIDEEEWFEFQQKVFREFGIMLYKEVFGTKITDRNIAQIIIGPVRSGQRIVSKDSILVIGDINSGAEIVSEKSIFVLGKIRGSVYAGMERNRKALIFALSLNPTHMQIANVVWNKEEFWESKSGYWVYIEDNQLKVSIYL
ncbi:MAG: septum site-determining protein MinC [Dictyoglomaceae bacterium]